MTTEETPRDAYAPDKAEWEPDDIERLLSYPPDDPLYAGGPTIEEYLKGRGIDYLEARGGHPHPGWDDDPANAVEPPPPQPPGTHHERHRRSIIKGQEDSPG